MEISEAGIKGLGPKKTTALQDAGITAVKDLAELDLRTFAGAEGVSKENLKALKQRARAACRREGIQFVTASYSTGKGRNTTKIPKSETTPARREKGLFARLLRK